jgi:hypothetical protein
MPSLQLIVLYFPWNDGYCYGELNDNCFISPCKDCDIRLDDCVKVDPSLEWQKYIKSIQNHLLLKQYNGTYARIQAPVKFISMIKIKHTGYLMPEIQLTERETMAACFPVMSEMPRKPAQCIAPPKPVEQYVFRPVPTVKRVHITYPIPAKPPVPAQIIKRRDSFDSTRAVRPNLNNVSVQKGTRGRSDSCDSTEAVRHFEA